VQWGWAETFANKANYLLELITWQNATPSNKAKLAKHKLNKPQLYIPDFMKPKQPPSAINKGSEAMTVDDIKSWLNTPRGV